MPYKQLLTKLNLQQLKSCFSQKQKNNYFGPLNVYDKKMKRILWHLHLKLFYSYSIFYLFSTVKVTKHQIMQKIPDKHIFIFYC